MLKIKGHNRPKSIITILNEKNSIGKFVPEKYHVSIYIEKSTGIIKKMTVEAGGKFVTVTGSSILDTVTVSEFEELDNSYKITIPKEVQDIKLEE